MTTKRRSGLTSASREKAGRNARQQPGSRQSGERILTSGGGKKNPHHQGGRRQARKERKEKGTFPGHQNEPTFQQTRREQAEGDVTKRGPGKKGPRLRPAGTSRETEFATVQSHVPT